MARATLPPSHNQEENPENAADVPVSAPGLRVLGRSSFALSRFFTRFDPSWAATLFAFAGVVVFLSLGSWQMQRLAQKNALLQDLRQGLADAPADLRHRPPQAEAQWKALDLRPVQLHGTWLNRAIKLAPRSFEEQVGYQLIMPLRLEDGQIVLVNRGFVRDGIAVLPDAESEVAVFGVAHLPRADKGYFVPENVPSRGEWVWTDLNAMAHEMGVNRTAPVMIYEDRVTDRDAYPIGGQLPLPLNNNHWHYAITWYALALSLLGVWMAASLAKPVRPSAATPAAHAEDLSDPVARRGRYPEATD